jgi:hypothetical protein
MEKLRKLQTYQQPREEPPGAPVAVAEPPEVVAPGIDVIYGASVQRMPLSGQTIAQVRPLMEAIYRVDPQSPVLVNGRPVHADYLLTAGDVLEFVHHAGEKGSARK